MKKVIKNIIIRIKNKIITPYVYPYPYKYPYLFFTILSIISIIGLITFAPITVIIPGFIMIILLILSFTDL